jgi:GT2 family glycosyltransferase
LLDSDDEWLPDKLRHQQSVLVDQSDKLVCHTEEIWMRAGKRVNAMDKHAKPEGSIYQQCLPLCCVSPSSILLKRSVLDDIGLFDESLPACEDYDLWLRIFRKYQVALVRQPMLIKYGGHSDQLSKKFWGMDRFRVQALVKALQDGKLTSQQYSATIEMLGQKCKVLINGFRKRGKHDQARYYSDICLQWGIALESC